MPSTDDSSQLAGIIHNALNSVSMSGSSMVVMCQFLELGSAGGDSFWRRTTGSKVMLVSTYRNSSFSLLLWKVKNDWNEGTWKLPP